jgi:Kelch motif
MSRLEMQRFYRPPPRLYYKAYVLCFLLLLHLGVSAADMRTGHCAFATNTTLYIFGGKSANNQTLNRFLSIDITNSSDYNNGRWNVLNHSNSFNIVDGACAITSTGKALMFGYDSDSQNSTSGVQMFDTVTQNWTDTPTATGLNATEVFSKRQGMASAIANDKVILFGGSTDGDSSNRTTYVLDTTSSPWNWTLIQASEKTPDATLGGAMIGIGRYAYHFSINTTSNNSCLVHAFDSKRLRWVGKIANYTVPAESVVLAGGNLSEYVWMIPALRTSTATTQLKKRATADNTTMWLFSSDDHSLGNQTETNSSYTPRQGSTATLIGASTLAIFGGNGNDSNLLVYNLIENQMVPQWSAVQVPTPAQPASPSQTPTEESASPANNNNRNRILAIVLGTVLGGLCLLVALALLVRHYRKNRQAKTAYSAPYSSSTRPDTTLEKPVTDPSNMPSANVAQSPEHTQSSIMPGIVAAGAATVRPLSRSISATAQTAKAAIASRFTEHFGRENNSVTPQESDEAVSSQPEDYLTEPRPAHLQPSNSDDTNETSNGSSNEVPPFRRSWS